MLNVSKRIWVHVFRPTTTTTLALTLSPRAHTQTHTDTHTPTTRSDANQQKCLRVRKDMPNIAARPQRQLERARESQHTHTQTKMLRLKFNSPSPLPPSHLSPRPPASAMPTVAVVAEKQNHQSPQQQKQRCAVGVPRGFQTTHTMNMLHFSEAAAGHQHTHTHASVRQTTYVANAMFFPSAPPVPRTCLSSLTSRPA